MYFGKLRLHDGYRLSSGNGAHTLVESNVENDLGVIISRDLKWSKQCAVSAAKADRVLGQIKSSFSYHGKETVLPLYTALVRPHLEYAVSVWSSSTKSNIMTLEKVKKRATKIIKPLSNKPYV